MSTNEPQDYSDDYSADDEDQLQPEDTLADDDVDDELDRGYSPPEGYSAAQKYGTTPWEQAHDRPLDDRLAEEVPEPDPLAEPEDEDGQPHDADEEGFEVGDARAGRLVAPDAGLGDDLEKDLVAEDVGIDGAAASAEEAAMHVVPDDALGASD
ncbi:MULTISPECIES: DUF5709 domain-containing protein [unclassified Nocardioides]|uniref:DUF5709 domain-containing protein n=1 Tax=unclassified Nocardioides TaxID=2615069 RepID=UPI0007027AFE|nr:MULTISPECIES: DUF5709 domain-containing protein [unclassified Nocardioides]KRC46572.1 hypothetical protein ASE19_22485 [Nocardioides sp. Root79]KRC69916.1 hypothetical protein ASE20_15335 [Nocardioides sp. Root240]